MKMWIRRNCRALLVAVLMVNLIAITITRPAWQDHIGYLQPSQTVSYGHSTVLGGVRWQLKSIKPPDKRELAPYVLVPEDIDELPANTRRATYLLQRDKDGKPAGSPAGYMGCEVSAVAGNRRWSSLSQSLAVTYWAQHLGYTTICGPKYPGPLFVAVVVPTHVHISSIVVDFLPNSWDDKKRLSKPYDLLVIGFDTD